MLYLIYGTDRERARKKASELARSLMERQPNAAEVRLNDESFKREALHALIEGQGLFAPRSLVLLSMVCEDANNRDDIIALAPSMAKSDTVFIMLEGSMTVPLKKVLTKHAVKIENFEQATKKEVKPFNSFLLADAFGAKQKKTLWALYQDALLSGKSAEELHGVLFWQVKAIVRAQNSETQKDAGLTPYAFRKASSFARNYSSYEIRSAMRELVSMYHNVRRGKGTLANKLERFILGLK
jgi:DNA polymerase III delta subunit